MVIKRLFQQINDHIKSITNIGDPLGDALWMEFSKLHPADIALFFENLNTKYFKNLFFRLPKKKQIKVFIKLTDNLKILILSKLNNQQKTYFFEKLNSDEITNLFDLLSDKELKKYIKLIGKKEREKIISTMTFPPESAGSIMESNAIIFYKDFAVEECIKIIQRIQPKIDICRKIYIINKQNKLVGYILLDDLLIHKPKTKLSEFMRNNEIIIYADEDREEIAKKMIHYDKTLAPVVDRQNHLLGIIPSSVLIDIIGEEAKEDVYKISAMAPLKDNYFGTSFFKVLYERSYILISLLLLQSISSIIIDKYHILLQGFLMTFITMLVSTGGNSSSQTSAVVIQGMATGEIDKSNIYRFLKRELLTALSLALILGLVAFARVYWTTNLLIGSFAVSLSLSLIVLVSIILGSAFPIILKRFNLDPAFSAGPFLATIMDILGLLIYCYVSNWILS